MKRFDWQLGGLPPGYDHKYTYSHIGYNLKVTDMQAAIGVEQLKKLPDFIQRRKKNFSLLYQGLKKFESNLLLPCKTPHSDPSWFGFPILVKEGSPFTRDDLVHYLESHKITTRMLFGGNLIKQPAYSDMRYRQARGLENTDRVMNSLFWIGVYPGLTEEMIHYVIKKIYEFMATSQVQNKRSVF